MTSSRRSTGCQFLEKMYFTVLTTVRSNSRFSLILLKNMNNFEYFLFYETNEKFYFDPCTSDRLSIDNNNVCLIIDRYSGEISIAARTSLPYSITDRLVYGIFGLISSLICKYLIIITRRKLVARINGENIFAIEATEILPYVSIEKLSKSIDEVRENQIYYQLIQTFLDQKYFYYSTTYDLTHTLQNLQNTDADFRRICIYKRADQRFVWNNFLMKNVVNVEKIDRFIFPIIFGFVESLESQTIDNRQFKLILVSRRGAKRAGVRFFSRGLDQEGNVSNFVENEQILEFEPFLTSFVQIRGSIPLFWSQKPNLERLPWPKIRQDQDHTVFFERHIRQQLQCYNNRLCILSLISRSGRELNLAQKLEDMCTKKLNFDEQELTFVAFDFQKECRKLDWSRLDHLISDLSPMIETFGYFCYNKTNLIDEPEISRQNGTFRTNCIDCLDRTNVVQSLIAKKSLELQLKPAKHAMGSRAPGTIHKLNILRHEDSLANYPHFTTAFNSVWADNGDFLSVQYAGTGALKADFTRTGRRTKLGLLSDGLNTGLRYYINNFLDGFRQDALDFCLGASATEDFSTANLQIKQDLHQATVKVVRKLNEWEWRHYIGILLIFVTCMFLLSLLLSTDSVFCYFWGLVSVLIVAYAYYTGEQIVCKPKLKVD
uniref:Phosphatidylinositol-3-phosphatase SAC1 n=1 Tax=Romanomermis culicivorax TaxID=13658 RepID=A0A915HQ64_ROMCU